MNVNRALLRSRKCLIIVALSYLQALTIVTYDCCDGSVWYPQCCLFVNNWTCLTCYRIVMMIIDFFIILHLNCYILILLIHHH